MSETEASGLGVGMSTEHDAGSEYKCTHLLPANVAARPGEHDTGSGGDLRHLLPDSLTTAEAEALKAKATGWDRTNPFRARLLARLGGPHRPSTVADDRHAMADEDAVALVRDLPAAVTESGAPF